VDLFGISPREKRSTFVRVLVAVMLAALLAPPIAHAAVQAVKVRGAVKVKDTGGGRIDAAAVGPMGLFEAPGSSGALAVRNYAGGGGFLGAVDCDSATTIPAGTATVNNSIVTAIIVTGTDAEFTVTAAALGGAEVLKFTMNAQNTTSGFASPSGLTLTAALTFTCSAGTDGNLVVLGQ